MAITAAELAAVITVNDTQFRAGMQRVSGDLTGLQKVTQSVTSAMATSFGSLGSAIGGLSPIAAAMSVGVAGAVGLIAKAAFDAAVAFDDASDKIRISTGAIGAELTALEGSFRTVFTSIPTSAAAASEAISFLAARLGITGKELEDLAKTELELARITGSALAPQLEATTRLFKDWGESISSPAEALDFLFKVSQKTAIGVTDLSQKLVQFGAPLRQLGFSFEEAAVLIGKFQAEGVELSKVLPGLRIALGKLAKEGVTDASEAFSRLIQRIQDAKTPLEAVGLAAKVFGQRAGSDMAEAIRQGRFSIDELMDTLEKSQSTIIQTGQDTNDFAEKWIILKNKASEALEPLGKLAMDALGLVTGAFSDNEAEIKRGWEQFWKDLGTEAGKGVQNIADALLHADKSPFFQAGAAMGEAVRRGFVEAFDWFMKWLFNIEMPEKMSNGVAEARDKINWGSERTKWGGEGFKVGQSLGKGLRQGHDSEVYKSPYFAVDAMDKALDKLLGIATTKGKKSGAALGQALTAGLKEHLDAINKAIDFFAKEVVDGMEELARSMAGAKEPLIEFVDGFEDAAAATQKLMDAAKDLIPAEKELEGVYEAGMKMIGNTEPLVRAAGAAQVLESQFEQLSQALPRAWNIIIDGFVRGGSAMSVKVKGFAADLITVFDTMPGKWGQSLNRALDEVNRWVSFIDAAIKLIQRIMGDEQTGLSGIFAKIGGIFKKTTQDVKEATQDISQGSEDMAQGITKSADAALASANKWVSAFATITGAAMTFFGTRNQGKFVGILGGAGAGAMIGSMFGPLGTAIGAGIGALVGLFGSGKSQAQKDAEKQAAERIKVDMQQAAQNVINAAIEGFDKALQFFEHLDEFTHVRKAKFEKFFNNFKMLMDHFLKLAQKWSAESLGKAKAAAEAIGPIAEAISALPNAFEAINGHFGVAQSAIDRFFADFSKVMDAFFERSEVWIDGISKRAMKVANRLNPVVELISAFGTAMTGISEVKEPADEMFAIFDRVIDKIITHVANLSLKFDKAVLKTMANFAEKAGAALAIWKEAIESIRATVDVPAPSEAGIDNVVAGIELFVAKLSESVNRLITTDLARVAAFANTIAPIAAAIKAWAETAEVVRGYTQIAAEVWEAIVADFERGLVLLNMLILDAQIYVEKATTFKTLIEQGTSLIDAALRSFGSGISAASSALTGGLPQGGTAIGTASASSMAPMSAASRVSATSSQTIQVNVTVQGSVIAQSQLNEEIMRQLEQGRRSGRISPSVFTGNLATVR